MICQPRCIYCGAEHYIVAVMTISRGQAGCGSCGRVPPVFNTLDDYHGALWDGAW